MILDSKDLSPIEILHIYGSVIYFADPDIELLISKILKTT